jgi:redox-sensitive bicupin YhaK (pirin superfamily)
MRKVKEVIKSKPTIEGAGVRLERVFGFAELPRLDPFLLLDDFRSNNPDDFIAGFPWHPHRGIETITYVLDGEVAHEDSLGNKGVIRGGDVQWMTAGGGIIQQEMPRRADGRVAGFQLWTNLPAASKMIAPRYRDLQRDQIPEVRPRPDVRIKIVAGEAGGVKGPLRDILIDPDYLDVTVGPSTVYDHAVKDGHTVFAYVVDGEGGFDPAAARPVGPGNLVLFGDGEQVRITTGKAPVRFLLISGRPLREPVAWYGPIVMNTRAELEQAFDDYRNGSFTKKVGG